MTFTGAIPVEKCSKHCSRAGRGEEKLERVSRDSCLKGFAGKEREMEQLKELVGWRFFLRKR